MSSPKPVDELMAAQRDASWYNRPNTRSTKRYHVVVGDWLPACTSRQVMLLDENGSRAAVSVPDHLRCQRPGCASRWPEAAR